MEVKQIQSVNQYIDLHKMEMTSLLEEFVKLPSCSREPEVMPAAAAGSPACCVRKVLQSGPVKWGMAMLRW